MYLYMLVSEKKLFAFSKEYGFTAKFDNGKWGASPISYMALLGERDINTVEISETEAIYISGGVSPNEYFENLINKLDRRRFCKK